MACRIDLVEKGGRIFELGRFNEGKKTKEQVALAAARKYKNLISKLETGTWMMKLHSSAKFEGVEIPVEAIKYDI
jgi:hypothetical protein